MIRAENQRTPTTVGDNNPRLNESTIRTNIQITRIMVLIEDMAPYTKIQYPTLRVLSKTLTLWLSQAVVSIKV